MKQSDANGARPAGDINPGAAGSPRSRSAKKPALSPSDIIRRVKLHNAVQIFCVIVLIPLSFVLWLISFGFFWVASYLPLSYVFQSAWTIGFVIACICMVPLLIDGIHNARPLFDFSDYLHSDLYNNFVMRTVAGDADDYESGNPAVWVYFVSQVLYAAPRTMILAVKALRCRLPCNDAVARDAARIVEELRASRRWTPASNYRQHGAALLVLDQLHLIWTDAKSGQIEIRYPAGQP